MNINTSFVAKFYFLFYFPQISMLFLYGMILISLVIVSFCCNYFYKKICDIIVWFEQ